MPMTRSRFLVAALIAAAMPATPWAQPAAERSARVIPVDRIVAVVNNDVITRIALDEHLRLVGDGLRRDGAPPPPRDVLEKQVLERMINQRVQLQFAADVGLRIDDSQLDRTIERIAQDNKLTVAGLRSALQKDGVPFSRFREDIRREMTIARLREREVDSKIVITEGEVDGYLQTASNVKAPANEYNLAHILVQVPEQASPEQIRARLARAEEAMEKIRGGADFRQVSASYSDAPEALQGGALGWRPADRLPTLFVDAVKSMRVGDVSPVLRSSNGFHILKLLDQRGSAPVIVQQTQARHILLKTNEIISETEARNRLLGLRERIENGAADFAELARLHSQDGSAARGGDLGWLSPGDTVPAFERAMNQLKPGQLSQPVKTEFGWHLIQVLARRDEDMSKERQRLLARQALRNRKSDEAYQEWVRQLRDKAYVEIKRERE